MFQLVPYESTNVECKDDVDNIKHNHSKSDKSNKYSNKLLNQSSENILDNDNSTIARIKKEPLNLQYIRNPTVEMFKTGLRSPQALYLVKQQTPEIVYLALKKNTFYKHQLNGTGILSVMKVYQDKTGVVMPLENVLSVPNINNPINSYPWLLDTYQKVVDKMITTIIEDPIFRVTDTLEFTFFCLRNNLTYRQANNLLSTWSRNNSDELFERLQNECPDFCKFLMNNNIQIVNYEKENEYVDHTSEYKLIDKYTKLLD